MRGKPLEALNREARGRNIPAHAGKTLGPGCGCESVREHPRACGENFPASYRMFRVPGTSPRMRGKQSIVLRQKLTHRNIPAHAGKTTKKMEEYFGP